MPGLLGSFPHLRWPMSRDWLVMIIRCAHLWITFKVSVLHQWFHIAPIANPNLYINHCHFLPEVTHVQKKKKKRILMNKRSKDRQGNWSPHGRIAISKASQETWIQLPALLGNQKTPVQFLILEKQGHQGHQSFSVWFSHFSSVPENIYSTSFPELILSKFVEKLQVTMSYI